ncbi:MAG: hypothetical protein IKN41_08160, partial [Candidatus Methanomethylophilaceae archaeon]|nr:hypothetical protein [Candidatus Methanomethylophilaceae archaeon]
MRDFGLIQRMGLDSRILSLFYMVDDSSVNILPCYWENHGYQSLVCGFCRGGCFILRPYGGKVP